MSQLIDALNRVQSLRTDEEQDLTTLEAIAKDSSDAMLERDVPPVESDAAAEVSDIPGHGDTIGVDGEVSEHQIVGETSGVAVEASQQGSVVESPPSAPLAPSAVTAGTTPSAPPVVGHVSAEQGSPMSGHSAAEQGANASSEAHDLQRLMHPDTWLSTVRQEYLRTYIRDGGGAVKFVVAAEDVPVKTFNDQLATHAQVEEFIYVKVDARYTKVHMVDRLFHKIAKQIDWDDLAYAYTRALLAAKEYQLPDTRKEFTFQRIAELNQRSEPLFRRDIQTWLEEAIETDSCLCREFRMAMMRLCLAQLGERESDRVLADAVKEWLCGDLRLISGVKKALIFQKVVRHNARYLLASLTHWLRLAGKPGVVVTVDIARYLVAKRPQEKDITFYYSSTAVLDLYDMLRQFIDTSGDLEGFFMVVTAPQEFLTDARRGVDRYQALKHRIWDDVRAKHRPNPLAPLVRLSSAAPTCSLVNETASTDPGAEGDAVAARRVIEGLRSGVPNRQVVETLGCPQGEIEWRFRRMLGLTQQSIPSGQPAKGLIIEGSFGSGKSHVLEFLQHVALEANFVCSRVVISKETPLYHPVRMFHAAIESAVMPNKRGEVLAEMASLCDTWDPKYKEFSAWVNSHDSGIDPRFAATLLLHERMGSDQELGYRMARFWTGDPIGVGELKRSLKECGLPGRYAFGKISQIDLAVQRFRFASRLMQAAGYAGWILLVDEAEVIGRYSAKQRAKSYAELARLVGGPECEGYSGVGVVVALTDDFQREVLQAKGDLVNIPQRLRATASEVDAGLAEHAERGMNVLDARRIPLEGPTVDLVQTSYQTIRNLHMQAHGWHDWAPETASQDVQVVDGMRMREYVKSWITELDLKRSVPEEAVEIEVASLATQYEEDAALASVGTDAADEASG